MKFLYQIVMFALLVSCCLPSEAQDWDFIKKKEGIRMYTRPQEGSAFKCFRGETLFHCGMEELGQYIGVASNFDQWDENIRELTVLESTPGYHVKCYFLYKTPWPLSNRDFFADLYVEFDSVSKTKTVTAYPTKKEYPERKGIVRMKNYWLKWTLEDRGDQTVNGIMEGFIDPEGLVPSWLYNLVIVEAPYKTMKGIKQKVEAP